MTSNEELSDGFKQKVIQNLKPDHRHGKYYFIIDDEHDDEDLGTKSATLFSVDTFVEVFEELLLEPTGNNLQKYIDISNKKGLGIEKHLKVWFREAPRE